MQENKGIYPALPCHFCAGIEPEMCQPDQDCQHQRKYTFRTWLLRLGMIGDEFKTARKFLLENLEGGIAWKDPEQAVRQKERLRAMKEKKELEIGHAQQADSMEEEVPEDAQGMNMTM